VGEVGEGKGKRGAGDLMCCGEFEERCKGFGSLIPDQVLLLYFPGD
jgi:hypothetical protein